MKNYIFQQHETHFSTYGKKNKKIGVCVTTLS